MEYWIRHSLGPHFHGRNSPFSFVARVAVHRKHPTEYNTIARLGDLALSGYSKATILNEIWTHSPRPVRLFLSHCRPCRRSVQSILARSRLRKSLFRPPTTHKNGLHHQNRHDQLPQERPGVETRLVGHVCPGNDPLLPP